MSVVIMWWCRTLLAPNSMSRAQVEIRETLICQDFNPNHGILSCPNIWLGDRGPGLAAILPLHSANYTTHQNLWRDSISHEKQRGSP